jgi:hypothetical protein
VVRKNKIRSLRSLLHEPIVLALVPKGRSRVHRHKLDPGQCSPTAPPNVLCCPICGVALT